jgi:hypothetical protein
MQTSVHTILHAKEDAQENGKLQRSAVSPKSEFQLANKGVLNSFLVVKILFQHPHQSARQHLPL